VVIGILVLLFGWPLLLVRSLVLERHERHDQVAAEVAEQWGRHQVLGGPVLVVPYQVPVPPPAPAGDGAPPPRPQPPVTRTAYFLPAELEVTARLEPEVRHRGIFETVVYRGDVELRGRFEPLDLAGWSLSADDLNWDAATLHLGLLDLTGLRSAVLTWDGEPRPLGPGRGVGDLWPLGLVSAVGGTGGPGQGHEVVVRMTVLGSGGFEVLPLARTTRVNLESPWLDPSFIGTFLPEERRLGADGFTARWTVPDLAQGRPHRWRQGELPDNPEGALAARRGIALQQGRAGWEYASAEGETPVTSVGVSLIRPVDHYQRTERAVKYGLLVVVLTFTTVFLLEVVGRVPLHPIQYLLVGGALVVFYLLLLSLAEHAPFGAAYLGSSLAVAGLVAGYAAAILRAWRRGAVLAIVLLTLYAFLWSLLTAVDYALLLGSLGLFAILALLMWFTRRVDWWSSRQPA